MVVCIALGVDIFRGGPCPPLYIRGNRVTWKVLAEYSWSPTTTQSGSFLCSAASSMSIQVVTKEVRYIHELSHTLEHSMSIISPAVPGLTSGLSLVVSHPWGCLFLGAQKLTSLVGKLDLATKCSGRKRNFSARCYKRTCEVITIICVHTLVAYLPEYKYLYSRNGNNKFVLCHGLGPI